MASSKPKKVISQDQLRRLMREKQFSVKTVAKKIEHPLAKYNSLDQLVCVLCSTVIKSNNLWVAHIQSSKHKEKYLESKTQGPTKPTEIATKRKLTDAEILAAKKAKVLTSDSNGLKTESLSAVKVSTLAGYSSSSEESEDEEEENKNDEISRRVASDLRSKIAPGPKELAADIFDPSSKAESDNSATISNKPAAMADALPEGFFDDPKMDAKVRQVEYKDKMDEEWERFQKSMKEESHVSEAIIEEEDEQATVERNLDEIDDQIQRWQEVEDLHVKKETIVKTSGDGEGENSDSDDLDEEALDQFLDWRSKKSW